MIRSLLKVFNAFGAVMGAIAPHSPSYDFTVVRDALVHAKMPNFANMVEKHMTNAETKSHKLVCNLTGSMIAEESPYLCECFRFIDNHITTLDDSILQAKCGASKDYLWDILALGWSMMEQWLNFLFIAQQDTIPDSSLVKLKHMNEKNKRIVAAAAVTLPALCSPYMVRNLICAPNMARWNAQFSIYEEGITELSMQGAESLGKETKRYIQGRSNRKMELLNGLVRHFMCRTVLPQIRESEGAWNVTRNARSTFTHITEDQLMRWNVRDYYDATVTPTLGLF